VNLVWLLSATILPSQETPCQGGPDKDSDALIHGSRDQFILSLARLERVVDLLADEHGAGEITLELPAGTFDNDDAVAAARRELAEETGWHSDEVTCIAEFFDDASKNTNRVYCVVALGATKSSDQMLDANESSSGVEVVEIDVTEVEKLLASGRVKAQSSVAAAYQALSWLRDRGVL
jgi:ADP-ribose pyrophosphatase